MLRNREQSATGVRWCRAYKGEEGLDAKIEILTLNKIWVATDPTLRGLHDFSTWIRGVFVNHVDSKGRPHDAWLHSGMLRLNDLRFIIAFLYSLVLFLANCDGLVVTANVRVAYQIILFQLKFLEQNDTIQTFRSGSANL